MPWWHLNWRSGTRRPESMPKLRAGTQRRRNDSAGRNGRPRRRRRWRACARARRLWNRPKGPKSKAFPKRRLQSPRKSLRLNLLVPHCRLVRRLVPHPRLVPPSRRGRLAHPNRRKKRVSEAEVAGDATEGEPGQSEGMKDRAEEMEGSEAAPATAETPGSARPKPRRRGRRGGRNRRRGPATASGAAPAPSRVPMARPAPRQDEVAPAQPVRWQQHLPRNR